MISTLTKLTDQRFLHSGITWQQFKSIQSGFVDAPGIRLFYYRGELEILSTSPEHEIVKSQIGHLVEDYFVEKGIEFTPTAQMTQEQEGEASLQADESYCLGGLKQPPDLCIEVVITSGGPNKLRRYLVLGVPEVWLWEDGLFSLYHLRGDRYEQILRSELLPDLDIGLLSRCVIMTSKVEAIREFRKHLISSGSNSVGS